MAAASWRHRAIMLSLSAAIAFTVRYRSCTHCIASCSKEACISQMNRESFKIRSYLEEVSARTSIHWTRPGPVKLNKPLSIRAFTLNEASVVIFSVQVLWDT